jgi:hypothetical protein
MPALDNLDRAARRSFRSAINKAARKSFTAASKSVRAVYNIKASDVRKYSRIRSATDQNLQATVTVLQKRLPVYAFGARQTKSGVTVRIKKAGGRKLIRGVFIAKMPGGETSVFRRMEKRLGDPRQWRHKLIRKSPRVYHGLPIKLLTTLDYASMFEKEGLRPLTLNFDKDFREIFERDLQFFLDREKQAKA